MAEVRPDGIELRPGPIEALQRRLLDLEREHLRLVERVRQLEEEKRDG